MNGEELTGVDGLLFSPKGYKTVGLKGIDTMVRQILEEIIEMWYDP